MAGGRSVSFEVYYLQYGRWQIHHRYSVNEREASIDEAKRLDSGHFDAACVIRESLDNSTGEATEAVIYHTPTLKTKPPVSFITSGSTSGGAGKSPVKNAPPGSAAANAMADARKKAAANKTVGKKSVAKSSSPKSASKSAEGGVDLVEALPKILIGFLISVVAATVAGMVALFILEKLASFGFAVSKPIGQTLLIATWFCVWLGVFVPLLKKALMSTKRAVVGEDDLAEEKTVDAASAAKAMSEDAASLSSEEQEKAEIKEEPPLALPPEPKDEIKAVPKPSLDEPPLATPPEAEAEPARPKDEPDLAEPPVNADADGEFGPEPVKAALAALVDEAKSATDNAMEKDQFLRFGVILFMAGAAETLARRFKIATRQLTDILSEKIETLGVTPQMARGFAANIDEYLLESRYFEMYSKGRSYALNEALGQSVKSGLTAALDFWKNPKAPAGDDPAIEDDPKHYDNKPEEPEAHGFVAVLFTDIVNSTQKQQENGDAWLMNVVRAHNDIVREALARHGGREIKHTGDGIMASFPAVNGSVESALAMQDGIAKFSEMMPELGFEICVGISAGEPTHESGDLFGTPVNLAARVLSKASPNETAVSSIVREMCRGKSFVFEELGRFELKGFDEPQPIFRVVNRRKKARGIEQTS